MEAVGQGVVTILLACDFDITIAHELGAHWREGSAVVVEGHVKTGGEDAGLETGGAEHGLLRESHLLEGEQLLGVDGLVDGEEVVLETGDLIKFFESDDGEGGGGEAVSAGILGGTGLALGSARAGALAGVGAVGRVLFFGDGHKSGPFNQQIARGIGLVCCGFSQVMGGKGVIFLVSASMEKSFFREAERAYL